MKNKASKKTAPLSRRDFIKTSAAMGVAAMVSNRSRIFAAGSDKIKAGLIGCGGRGTGAAMNCVDSSPNIEIVSIGDLFEDRVKRAHRDLKRNQQKIRWSSSKPWQNADKVKVTEETCFTGFDAYEKVIASDVDLVVLASPPHFRPKHLKAAIEAGKHVFMEKPVAVDPVGIRSIIETSELAKQKGLAIVAGTQRRHQAHYIELMKRIHDGQIGELAGGQCYWNWDKSFKNWPYKWNPEASDMENQIRRWVFYTWLSGDIICEQHVHNIDVINWAFGAHPVKAMGMGGRQYRVGEENGNVYDHFAVEFEYPNGARVMSMCRQTDGADNRISERVVGTKGNVYTDQSNGSMEGKTNFKYPDESPNPYEQEHTDLITSIREGKPLNEGKRVAESTMTAIMGRISAYTGRALKWEWVMEASKLDLTPESYELGPVPTPPVAVPGTTKLV